MKLIVDVPEEVKETFDKADDINFCFYDYNSVIGKAIRNGIPLENIIAEIKEKAKEHIKYTDYGRRENGLYEALEIIDKRISELKGE